MRVSSGRNDLLGYSNSTTATPNLVWSTTTEFGGLHKTSFEINTGTLATGSVTTFPGLPFDYTGPAFSNFPATTFPSIMVTDISIWTAPVASTPAPSASDGSTSASAVRLTWYITMADTSAPSVSVGPTVWSSGALTIVPAGGSPLGNGQLYTSTVARFALPPTGNTEFTVATSKLPLLNLGVTSTSGSPTLNPSVYRFVVLWFEIQ